MIDINFNDDNAKNFILGREVDSMQERVEHLHVALENKTGQGSDSLGWLHLPSLTPPSLFDSIYSAQREIREQCNTFVCSQFHQDCQTKCYLLKH